MRYLLAFVILTTLGCQSQPLAQKIDISTMVIAHKDKESHTDWQSQATFLVDKESGGLHLLVRSRAFAKKNSCEAVNQHYMWDPQSEAFILIDLPKEWPLPTKADKASQKCKNRVQINGPVDYT